MKKQGKKIVAAAPVEKNQELLLTIDGLGSKGEGVGRGDPAGTSVGVCL